MLLERLVVVVFTLPGEPVLVELRGELHLALPPSEDGRGDHTGDCAARQVGSEDEHEPHEQSGSVSLSTAPPA
jgi:hypothetical protein